LSRRRSKKKMKHGFLLIFSLNLDSCHLCIEWWTWAFYREWPGNTQFFPQPGSEFG
jgi:hypothetical protein